MLQDKHNFYFDKIKINKQQEKDISVCLEDLMIHNKSINDDTLQQYEGVTSVFNNLFFFVIGDGLCKDMFSCEEKEYLSVMEGKYPATVLDSLIEDKVSILVNVLKKEFTESQLINFIDALNVLFVTTKFIIDNEVYVSNQYQLGYYKTQKEILKELKLE
jgi:hypothetical protein